MEIDTYLLGLVKVLLPALIVLLAAVFLMRWVMAGKGKASGQALSLRLQGYERLTLLIERIRPASLLLRNQAPGLGAKDFNALLIASIREEFEHNITQQLYVSEDSWNRVRVVKDKTISLINDIARQLPEDAVSMDLSRALLNHMAGLEKDPYEETLAFLRKELSQLL